MDDAELVELIQAWERLAGWVAAGQLAAIAELARRRPRDLLDRSPGPIGPLSAGVPDGARDSGHPGLPEVSEFAVDEIAAALRLSRPAAGIRLHTAVELTRLPATAAALQAGALDLPKVRAVVEAVSILDRSTALVVEARVLPRADRQTVGQVRASLSRAVLSVDPQAAEQRHARAQEGRQVTVRPLPDGMAELWALLPADSAVAVYSCIDRLARSTAADGRSMDARRADTLVATILTPSAALIPTTGPAGPAAPAGSMVPAGPAAPAGSVASAGSMVPAGPAAPAGSVASAGSMVPAGPAASAGAGSGVVPGGGVRSGGPAVVASVHVTVPAATALGSATSPASWPATVRCPPRWRGGWPGPGSGGRSPPIR